MDCNPNHILLVDDDALTNEFHKALIKKVTRFHGASSFTSSKDLLGHIKECFRTKEELPFVYLIDIMMPDVDGFELIDELNEIYEQNGSLCSPRFIVATSSNHNRDLEKFERLPNTKSYVQKPLNEKKLIEAVEVISKD